MKRPLAEAGKFRVSRRREKNQGHVWRYEIIVGVAGSTSAWNGARIAPGGACGHGRGNRGGVPGMWGGGHLGQEASVHLVTGHPLG